MYDTYARIFTRLGLKFRAVKADTGAIGGNASHEFHVLAESGEDAIAFSAVSDYAANIELAEALAPTSRARRRGTALEKVDTPTQKTIDEPARFLKIDPRVREDPHRAGRRTRRGSRLRGDHEINEVKAQRCRATSQCWRAGSEIWKAIKCKPGFIGPVKLRTCRLRGPAAGTGDFVCGANEQATFHRRQLGARRSIRGRGSAQRERRATHPPRQGHLKIGRGIEVGHVFPLGTKYASHEGDRAG